MQVENDGFELDLYVMICLFYMSIVCNIYVYNIVLPKKCLPPSGLSAFREVLGSENLVEVGLMGEATGNACRLFFRSERVQATGKNTVVSRWGCSAKWFPI